MTPPEYEIEFRWKETVYYGEGPNGCQFDGGWGVSPMVTYVPSAAVWPDVAPGWVRDRRELILKRLVDHGAGHRVEEADHWPFKIGVTPDS